MHTAPSCPYSVHRCPRSSDPRRSLAGGPVYLGFVLLTVAIGLGALNCLPSRVSGTGPAEQPAATEPADDSISTNITDLSRYVEAIRAGAEFDLEEATALVFQGTRHSDDRRIGLGENWVQWLLGHVYPPLSRVQDAQRLVRGGIANCSERAQILKTIAEAAGYECRFIGLSGHVVLDVQHHDTWCVADPDYGVVFPVDLPALETAEGWELIQERLSRGGYPPDVIAWYRQVVQTQEDNCVLPVGSPLSPRLYAIEVNCRWLAWAIPAGCLLSGLLTLVHPRSFGRWAPAQNSRSNPGAV